MVATSGAGGGDSVMVVVVVVVVSTCIDVHIVEFVDIVIESLT